MSKKTVLIIDLAKYYGGTDVRVFDLAAALEAAGRPYTVLTLQDAPIYERLIKVGLNAQAVPYGRSNPRLLPYVRNLIKAGGYGVVDAHNPQSQFWGHLAAMGLKDVVKVSTVHSAYRLEHDGNLKGRSYESVLYLNRRLGARFIAVTEAVHDYLIGAGLPFERVNLIHNSLSLKPLDLKRAEVGLFNDLGWDESHYVMIHVARLEPVKAHGVFIDGMAQIVGEFPNFRYLIVGDGRLRGELEAQVSALNLGDYVHFAGFRDDIPSLLAASDAFCLPSLSEGLPYAVLEATSQSLPMLVTSVGGMAELLEHQQTAYLVPPSDPNAIAAGLRWLLSNQDAAAQMGVAARDLVQRKFSPEEMIAKTLAVYDA